MSGPRDASPSASPDVGRLVGGRYRLGELVGIGGMATVHRALDTRFDRAVAVKLLRREVIEDADIAMRFRREALAATVLRHPNIVACLEAGTDDGQPYLVMELIEGEDLAARLRRGGRLPPADVARLGLDIARGLGVAHIRGIVHRDVKPGNILLARDGRAMVTDFGIARLAADTEGAVPGTTLGSVQYFSPEQARGAGTTAASDVYGLGLVLYEALTGRRAWSGDTTAALAAVRIDAPAPSPRTVRPDVPATIDAVVVRALDADPERRYANGGALAAALEPIVGRPDPASPTVATDTAGLLAAAGAAGGAGFGAAGAGTLAVAGAAGGAASAAGTGVAAAGTGAAAGAGGIGAAAPVSGAAAAVVAPAAVAGAGVAVSAAAAGAPGAARARDGAGLRADPVDGSALAIGRANPVFAAAPASAANSTGPAGPAGPPPPIVPLAAAPITPPGRRADAVRSTAPSRAPARPSRWPSPAVTGPLLVLLSVLVVVGGGLFVAAMPPGDAAVVLAAASASPRPTARPTATPRPTAAPTPTPKPTAKPTAKPAAKPTPAPTPRSAPAAGSPDLCDPFFGLACGLDAGRYAPATFEPAIRFDLRDGWSTASQTTRFLVLGRRDGTLTFASGIDAVYSTGDPTKAPGTARGLVEAFITTDGVASGKPAARKVDKRRATVVDLWPSGRGRLPLFGAGGDLYFLEASGPTRIVVVDGPDGVLIIAVEAGDGSALEDLWPEAKRVIDGLRFR